MKIKVLLDKELIMNSKSLHTSLPFMVRSHVEEKREKVRITINYKILNNNTVFNGYHIHNKMVLFSRI